MLETKLWTAPAWTSPGAAGAQDRGFSCSWDAPGTEIPPVQPPWGGGVWRVVNTFGVWLGLSWDAVIGFSEHENMVCELPGVVTQPSVGMCKCHPGATPCRYGCEDQEPEGPAHRGMSLGAHTGNQA